jgi:uncharacterized protein YfaT (DUF1175 family)
MMRRASITLLLGALTVLTASGTHAQVRLTDASDRAALRAWFVLLADAQFYQPTPDVTDCAALVRHALREAFRPHTPDWLRQTALPVAQVHPDVRVKPAIVSGGGFGLFRVPPLTDAAGAEHARYAEFADAKTIVRLNATPLGRDLAALRPGDLIYFRQPSQRAPDHLMVFVGRSAFEAEGADWIVYHTGDDPGEVRKVRLAVLLEHPVARWRPLAANGNFVGIFRLHLL